MTPDITHSLKPMEAAILTDGICLRYAALALHYFSQHDYVKAEYNYRSLVERATIVKEPKPCSQSTVN